MRRLLLGVFTTGALMILTSTASATTIQTTDTSSPWQQWANSAQVPTWQGTLPLTVAPRYFTCGTLPERASCTTTFTTSTNNPDGSVTPQPPTFSTTIDGDQTNYDGTPDLQTVRGTLYHELGTIFWSAYLTPADETRFIQIVGLTGDSSDWGNQSYTRIIDGVTLTFAPFEWFEEGYRYCATYGINQPLGVGDSEGLGYPGSESTFAAQQRQVCRLIDQIGVRNGIATPPQANYPAAKPVKRSKPPHATTPPKHRRDRLITWGRRRVW